MRNSPVSPWCRRAARAAASSTGEDLSAIGEKLLSGRRQADAAVGTGKQASAGLLLKDLNLLA